jgi:hypothetical protein
VKDIYPALWTAFYLLKDHMDLHRPRGLSRRISQMGSAQRLYWRWMQAIYAGPRVKIAGGEKLTVLLQSYQRPWNMDRQVRAAARCAFVSKILLSNNHPDVDLEKRLTCRDPRLVLVQNRVHRRAGFRWHLARAEDVEYMLSMDDDVFLFPGQIAGLFQCLIDDSEVPHGLFGTVYRGLPAVTRDERKKTESFVTQKETEVDVLHRVYGIGRVHLKNYFKYLDRSKAYRPLSEDAVGDDIAISFASTRRPRVHDLGPILLCPSSRWSPIALHQEKAFFEKRREILMECMHLQPRDPPCPLKDGQG